MSILVLPFIFLNLVVVSSLLFHPGALLKDTDGNIIRAHQPHVYNYSQGLQEVTSGHCKSAALLTSAAECQAAGKVLGLSGAVQTGSWGYIPPGCSWQDADNLWFNTNKASTHACQDGTDNGICLCVDSAQNDTKYYLLGSSQVGASAGIQGIVNLYTSTDLHSWQFEGGVYNHSGDSRPSLLGRNPRTGLYVLWAKGTYLYCHLYRRCYWHVLTFFFIIIFFIVIFRRSFVSVRHINISHWSVPIQRKLRSRTIMHCW